jgi:hypothetical protein
VRASECARVRVSFFAAYRMCQCSLCNYDSPSAPPLQLCLLWLWLWLCSLSLSLGDDLAARLDIGSKGSLVHAWLLLHPIPLVQRQLCSSSSQGSALQSGGRAESH